MQEKRQWTGSEEDQRILKNLMNLIKNATSEQKAKAKEIALGGDSK